MTACRNSERAYLVRRKRNERSLRGGLHGQRGLGWSAADILNFASRRRCSLNITFLQVEYYHATTTATTQEKLLLLGVSLQEKDLEFSRGCMNQRYTKISSVTSVCRLCLGPWPWPALAY